ncbi:hypothetical protein [Streptomyces sp. enrichment culture]|uniref:hypothetical protein n=1 Tax=Streptomyces sp. enrichment culture TaxID=1795815 RepID=UPI003F57A129
MDGEREQADPGDDDGCLRSNAKGEQGGPEAGDAAAGGCRGGAESGDGGPDSSDPGCRSSGTGAGELEQLQCGDDLEDDRDSFRGQRGNQTGCCGDQGQHGRAGLRGALREGGDGVTDRVESDAGLVAVLGEVPQDVPDRPGVRVALRHDSQEVDDLRGEVVELGVSRSIDPENDSTSGVRCGSSSVSSATRSEMASKPGVETAPPATVISRSIDPENDSTSGVRCGSSSSMTANPFSTGAMVKPARSSDQSWNSCFSPDRATAARWVSGGRAASCRW